MNDQATAAAPAADDVDDASDELRDVNVEFTVPMEGPRTDAAPKGVSRRPGSTEFVTRSEADRLTARGMAFELDGEGKPLKTTTHRQVEPETRPANPPGVERAVTVPPQTPAPAKPAGAGKGK
jgi:hypothetical protein